jgi:hypothetical protein
MKFLKRPSRPTLLQSVFSLCFFSMVCCGMGWELMREGEWVLRHTIMVYPLQGIFLVVFWTVILVPAVVLLGTIFWICHKFSPE